ncbi:MAG: DUF3347 domain-containing protein [Saprospiraceae bacterium]
MKKTILLVSILFIGFDARTFAQQNESASLQKVINAYLDVKNALTKDDGKNVLTSSKSFYEVIINLTTNKLAEVEQRVWMEYRDKLSAHAEHMKSTDLLAKQREYFIKLSADFYKMVKVLNSNEADLYYQYCPMANEGKGAYWVSEKQAIANPYFGKMMMTCGSTKETIKAKQ